MGRTRRAGRTSSVRERQAKPAGRSWSFVFIVFVLSRLLFLGVGAVAQVLLPQAEPGGSPLEPPGFLNYWAHWDGAWYSEIATGGYEARSPASTAFFPLFPMAVRLGTLVGVGPALSGVVVSLVATLLAFYFLYGIAERLYDARAARATVLTIAFFPTSFFLNAVYTEALFLAFVTASAWALYTRRDLLLAGLIGAFAAATRNVGVFLVVPLAWEWLRHRSEFGRRGLVEICLVPAGLAAYAIFLGGRFGDPLLFAHEQEAYWGRTLTDPAATLNAAWTSAGEGLKYALDPEVLFLNSSAAPALGASNTLNFVFIVLFLVLMGIGLAALPPGLSIYTFIITLTPILAPSPDFPLMSLPRFMLGAFPFFLVLGFLLSRSKTALVLWLTVSIVLGVALTALFTTWRWVA